MRYLVFLLISMMIVSQLSAQSVPSTVCPSIVVFGPSGVPKPGELIEFEAKLDDRANNYRVEFNWQVSIGTIVFGQGTKRIKVEYPNDRKGIGITAKVEVTGLPGNCATIASETTTIFCGGPKPVLLDETDEMPDRLSSDRFISIYESSSVNPSAQIYIVVYTPRNAARARSFAAKRSAIIDRFRTSTEIDLDRITFVESTGDNHLIKFYLLQAGADIPLP